ncbi:MAG: valine--pyruvate transaminase [Cyanobacteria bacterium J06642_2]
MEPHLTQIGQRMSRLTGVRAIMKDIVETLRAGDGSWINLSAGNPVILSEIVDMWRECTQALLASDEFGQAICRYGASQGYEPLIEAIVADFKVRYGWNLTRRNVLITPGSQSLYFFAANAFGGRDTSGTLRPIVLPLSPDYTGYGGVSLTDGAIRSYRPSIDVLGPHRFKYRPDFDRLQIDASTGAVLFSRPCNPTGNVVTDAEVRRIVEIAAASDVPVLIDSAYAPPFPNLTFTDMQPIWADNVMHCMSLSKAGLPGERIGIAIGHPDLLLAIESFQSNANIHSSRFGQAIAARAIASGELARLSESVIKPHYKTKFDRLEAAFDREMPADVPWYLHKGEGAIFAWLWLQDLPMTDVELYGEIKQERVIVVPGASFFPGLEAEAWEHKQQCLRISLTATIEEIERGVAAIARVVNRVYNCSRVPATVAR